MQYFSNRYWTARVVPLQRECHWAPAPTDGRVPDASIVKLRNLFRGKLRYLFSGKLCYLFRGNAPYVYLAQPIGLGWMN